MQKEKDILRKYIEMRLPSLRKPSLKTETEILEDFVEKRKIDPDDKRYSRNYDGVPNIIYHLGRLEEADTIEALPVKELAGFDDEAEKNLKLRIKRTRKDIQDVRILRTEKLLEHAKIDRNVMAILYKVLNVSSMKDASEKIFYAFSYQDEKINLDRYNKVVYAIKAAGIQCQEYGNLGWKNKPKPWKLKQSFIDYLKSNGVDMEG